PTQSNAVLRIKPDWFETIWAQALYVITVMLLLRFIYRLRVRQLKQQAVVLNATIEHRTSEIQALLEQRTRFFAFVSHELKTPLTLVQDPLNRLAKHDKHASPRNSELINIARRNAMKISVMIERLLDSSTVQHQKPRHTVFIEAKVDNAIMQLSEFAAEHSVTLEKHAMDDCAVMATDDEIDIILFNLLSNAIKYNRVNGRVYIGCVKSAQQCILSVTDEGKGFAATIEQGEETGKNRYGLKLVKQVVLSLDGKLDIESNENVTGTVAFGTTVTVRLHQTDKPAEAIITPTEEPHINPTAADPDQPIVFIVEDNKEMRHYISGLFADNYQCMRFSNAEDALGKAIEMVPDVIISDVGLPCMSGIELCRQIKENQQTCHIPVLLLTGDKNTATQIIGLQNHANDYMTKPFNGEALTLKVASLLKLIAHIRQSNQRVSLDNAYTDDNAPGLVEKDRLLMQRFTDILALNYHDTDYNLDGLCKDMFMSKTQLSRKLQAISNKSPIEYLKEYRLERAMVLLSQGMALGMVAMETGFSSQSYFSTCFKSYFGTTPKKHQLTVIEKQRENS
ncbi:MAG: response regulator, partial [Algicola sp.]|nr:response regulator [Algicola sp.]